MHGISYNRSDGSGAGRLPTHILSTSNIRQPRFWMRDSNPLIKLSQAVFPGTIAICISCARVRCDKTSSSSSSASSSASNSARSTSAQRYPVILPMESHTFQIFFITLVVAVHVRFDIQESTNRLCSTTISVSLPFLKGLGLQVVI